MMHKLKKLLVALMLAGTLLSALWGSAGAASRANPNADEFGTIGSNAPNGGVVGSDAVRCKCIGGAASYFNEGHGF
jgi:hypothetical protein